MIIAYCIWDKTNELFYPYKKSNIPQVWTYKEQAEYAKDQWNLNFTPRYQANNKGLHPSKDDLEVRKVRIELIDED